MDHGGADFRVLKRAAFVALVFALLALAVAIPRLSDLIHGWK